MDLSRVKIQHAGGLMRGYRQSRLIAACCLLFALVGCTPEDVSHPPVPELPQFTVADFPKLDGSAAAIPLASALLQQLAGASSAEADLLTDFSTTAVAYRKLVLNIGPSLLLAYEPDPATKEAIAETGVELEYHPIGRDALVFLTNQANPVTGMTADQLKSVYTGAITNWKDLGGADQPIIAYQHPAGSGSQAMLQKLLTGDAKLAKAPTELVISMDKLTEGVANYSNTVDALGFSSFYYVTNMLTMPQTKLLSVDGVTPTQETITSGAYPFTTELYAVLRSDEPPDSLTRQLATWLESPAGTQLISTARYVTLVK
jgi:phosphate transport system substrate-binding protein